MHDVRDILSRVFRSSLDDLREQYSYLEELDSFERDRVVAEANHALAAIQSAISHPDTLRAKDILVTYQYVTRFIYDVDPQSKRHFVESLNRLSRDDDADVSAWNWRSPSKAEFLARVARRILRADFYTQVNLLCDELFGLPIPSASDGSLRDWSARARLTEPDWSWRYENQIREEKARWFSSQKRLSAIESQWADHRAKAAQCMEELASDFPDLPIAKSRLQDLKGKQLWLSGRCTAINRAADALRQGVQLKHLLVEEARGMERIIKAASRGL